MGLFKRKKSKGSPCPRCAQLASESDAFTCPLCGWDLRDAYQGPAYPPVNADDAEPTGAHIH